jgi:hypothetical protein
MTPPSESPGGRSFRIRPGFIVTVGYVVDGPAAQLAELHAQGVLTAVDLESATIDQAWAQFDDRTALGWRELGFTPTEAAELAKTGGKPDEVAAVWRETGIPAREIADWIGAGLTPREAVDQRGRGVSRDEAAAMRGLRNPDWR